MVNKNILENRNRLDTQLLFHTSAHYFIENYTNRRSLDQQPPVKSTPKSPEDVQFTGRPGLVQLDLCYTILPWSPP